MAFEVKEYPPRVFSDKYHRYLAPRGVLITPSQVFQSKKVGGATGEQNIRKAFKITIKKLKKMRDCCSSCLKRDGELMGCSTCGMVKYCSKKCQEQKEKIHAIVCSTLKQEMIDQVVECLPSPVPLGQDVLKGRGGRVKDWDDWFTRHTSLADRISVAAPIVSEWWDLTGLDHPGEDALQDSLKRIISNMFSTVLTIGHSPFWFSSSVQQMKPSHGPMPGEVNIHLLGAGEPEVSVVDSGIIQVASRVIGAMLRVTLVAPDLAKEPETLSWKVEKPYQATPLVRASAYHGLYHDFWKDHIDTPNNKMRVPRPDVCLAIHPGVHTKEMFILWRPTLELLAAENIPLLLTMYNKVEYDSTVRVLNAVKAPIIHKGENPLRSLHAKQTSYELDHIWALNDYIIAVDNTLDINSIEEEEEEEDSSSEEEADEEEEEGTTKGL